MDDARAAVSGRRCHVRIFHPGAGHWRLSVAVGAQVIGRLLGYEWIERYGPVRAAMVLSAISLVGLVLVVIGASVPLSLLGFALIGFGVATSFPQAMSAAARLGDRPASVNVASISFMNSLVLFLTRR